MSGSVSVLRGVSRQEYKSLGEMRPWNLPVGLEGKSHTHTAPRFGQAHTQVLPPRA
jgi:hypothetical protein